MYEPWSNICSVVWWQEGDISARENKWTQCLAALNSNNAVVVESRRAKNRKQVWWNSGGTGFSVSVALRNSSTGFKHKRMRCRYFLFVKGSMESLVRIQKLTFINKHLNSSCLMKKWDNLVIVLLEYVWYVFKRLYHFSCDLYLTFFIAIKTIFKWVDHK